MIISAGPENVDLKQKILNLNKIIKHLIKYVFMKNLMSEVSYHALRSTSRKTDQLDGHFNLKISKVLKYEFSVGIHI
jgi:hypothetical protein